MEEKKKSYEGKGFTRNLDSDKIKFSKPKLGEKKYLQI